MKYYKKIPGNRVYLSPMNIDDLEKYTEWFNDRSVTDGLGDSYYSNNTESEKAWLEDNLKKQAHQYAVILSENDELIGNIGIEDIHPVNKTCIVGLFIGDEDKRGMGYGSEALSLMVGYAFDILNMNNIMLKVFEFNERAINAYKKVGFSQFGRQRGAYYLDNKYHDVIYMDITREDWYKKTLK